MDRFKKLCKIGWEVKRDKMDAVISVSGKALRGSIGFISFN